MLLAIDTSAGTSVAVVDLDRGVIAEQSTTDTMRHAEVVGRLIADCLRDAAIPISALSAVVGGMGPGPFTGLRVGIAAARVFALGAGVPFVPVVSHDALAFGRYEAGHTGPLVVVTDARRREVNWSVYSGADAAGLPIRVDGPGVAKPAVLLEAEWLHAAVPRFDAVAVSAAELGQVAELMWAHHRPFAADEALYLRSPDVTLSSGPKRVS
ncbi:MULTISPECIES: tRNA (adenosine(37)-N6)-threonylcarbamoyltransferase complex dimerization subunit type 1 TsaB [Cryobacterium]|uniref:tRNA (Adenosine(37)-N6)-threonylcarbamoyltransferase complex dimerization subunit type 1 TsaB n=1 Tax=Cryobacterium breve TaxID=1259258 RepID=A0ABY2J3H0_9MICO|nr:MULTISPECIES: tRNA (adenosine(37)-N6)-threonylcarbamoyltransferase complex dimerization subunit type 1 TsaB [Cryobacterium]TFC91875.1 tRNA (adenosine(37)-N6)-threonylcarbamoyltransferase complex dimerization subunit type 1 TsaB [Cryobacterium sp. TmT3-12]TFC98426.1 tRNA (adenosine(37)-N6)-threonylcarbamoyltransferase complex dimerization subunit type 1 TsaB [Cryobacterium breve]